MNINLLLADTKRSNIYLNELLKNKITIGEIIVYSKKKLLYLKKIILKINFSTKIKVVKSNSVNSRSINNLLLSSKNRIFLFSGYSGEIIKNKKILKEKELLHCHPGKIPDFRGSTTIYYSIILKKKVHCSLFRLTNKIDKGKVYFVKKFNIPKIKNTIEGDYDNSIRAKTLSYFFKNSNRKTPRPKKEVNNYYYIAHPVIRNLVLDKNQIKKNLI